MTKASNSLPSERVGHPADEALLGLRLEIKKAAAAGAWRTNPPAREESRGGVETLRFDPPGPTTAILVHFHGGGYRIGCPEQVGPFAAALAKCASIAVICPRYRLAPEHPYPAALIDGLSAIRAARVHHLPLILSGDSAGGGLAAAMTARLIREGAPPNALILLSPWLDLTATSASYEENAGSDPLFSRLAATSAAQLYLQGTSAGDVNASPIFAPVTGFPPTLIAVGSGEVLIDDSRRFAAALVEAGQAVQLEIIPGMKHVAVIRGAELIGSAQTFDTASAFVRGVIGKAG